MNAASCWKSCCCHTNAQKLAWAKQHGVTPPAFVVAAAQREACAGGCCLAKQSPTRRASDAIKTQSTSEDPTTDFTLVTIDSYRECQGLPPLWVLLTATTIPNLDVFEISAPAAGQWLTISSESQTSLSFAPDAPPPRQA